VPLESTRQSSETFENRLPASTATLAIPDPAIAQPEIYWRSAGKQIDFSEQQILNAHSPRNDSLQPDSKVTLERSSQPTKHNSEIMPTDDGIEIDRSAEHPSNADSPRMDVRQPDSNVTVKRFSQDLKQAFEIASTDEGTKTV
jgi:hypothetical protein